MKKFSVKNIFKGRRAITWMTCLLIAVFFAAAIPRDVQAAPAAPFPFYFEQSDGSEIMLFFRGDEFFSWWEDDYGYIVAYDEESGNWRYAYIVNRAIEPVGQIAGAFDPEIAGPGRITREAIQPLIQSGWRFDPGDPTLEFVNGQIFRNNAEGSVLSPKAPVIPTLIQAGQGSAPFIPGFNNAVAPGGQIAPPTAMPPTGGGQTSGSGNDDGPAIIGFAPAAPLMSHLPSGMPSFSPGIPLGVTPPARQIQLNQRLLVVLIEFDNVALLRDSAFYYDKYFNTSPGAISVTNYFRDMAGGRNIFTPAGNVNSGGSFRMQLPGSNVPWAASGVNVTITPSTHNGVVHVRFHMNHPNSTWAVPSGHEATQALVSLAVSAIHNNSNFNFAGVNVSAVIAGGEAATHYNHGGQTWAHAWSFQGSLVGQTGWMRYAAYGERQRGGHIVGIGIATHELGHVLGLPDLYDLTGASEGVGPYSLMAHGIWGRGPGDTAIGQRPTALDPWSRMQLGFVQPTVVRDNNWSGDVNSFSVGGGNILMVTTAASSSQFFLVENRQMDSGWDLGMHQWINNPNVRGGIIIYHIDESMRSENPSDMTRNNNNRNRLMVGVREADGSNFLFNSVARWNNANSHFFTADSHQLFSAASNPNSNFHTATGRNAPSGVEIIVHGERSNTMEVEIIATRGGAPSGAPAAPMFAAAAAFGFTADPAALNHTRIQNQVSLNASVPTLTLTPDTTEILLYNRTIQLLLDSNLNLAINSETANTLLSTDLLREILETDNGGILRLIVTEQNNHINIDF